MASHGRVALLELPALAALAVALPVLARRPSARKILAAARARAGNVTG